MPKTRFRLASPKQRELFIEVDQGAPLDRTDVEAADDRDIVFTLSAEGAAIGGMTYRLAPRPT